MTSAKADIIKEIIRQLKLHAAWTSLASVYFGMELGKHIWNLHDDFYPFTILLWGALTTVMVFGFRGTLVGLSLAVPLADADAVRVKTRGMFLIDVGFACISFCFGLCLGPAKHVGGMYRVGAVALGAISLLIGFLMYRAIKSLSAFVNSLVSPERELPL